MGSKYITKNNKGVKGVSHYGGGKAMMSLRHSIKIGLVVGILFVLLSSGIGRTANYSYSCQDDSDCAGGYKCIDNRCGGWSCKSDQDCPGSAVCCEDGNCSECCSDDDCPFGGFCVDGACICSKSSDCSAGYKCVDGSCRAQSCKIDEDCYPTGQKCCEGECKLECCSVNDCPKGGFCVAGVCACKKDSDCLGGNKCIDNRCGGWSCKSDQDCPGSAVCCEDGNCSECCSDDDCIFGGKCLVGYCKCNDASDCWEGYKCMDGECGPQLCKTDADCSKGICCEKGYCQPECCSDEDCIFGGKCLGGYCKCNDDSDCLEGYNCIDGRCGVPAEACQKVGIWWTLPEYNYIDNSQVFDPANNPDTGYMPAGEDYEWSWSFGDGSHTISHGLEFVNHTYSYPGVYTVEITGHSKEGFCAKGAIQVDILMKPHKMQHPVLEGCPEVNFSKLKEIDGPLSATLYYVDLQGLKQGPYIDYNGTDKKYPERTGCYLNDKKTGHWISYSMSTGEKYEEGDYIDDNRTGHWIYYSSGSKEGEGDYKNDKKTGHWVFYQVPGIYNDRSYKWIEGDYINGEATGHWIEYYGNGSIESEADCPGEKCPFIVERIPVSV